MNKTLSHKWAMKILKRKNSIIWSIISALLAVFSLVVYLMYGHDQFALMFIGFLLISLLNFERNGFNQIINEKNIEIKQLNENNKS